MSYMISFMRMNRAIAIALVVVALSTTTESNAQSSGGAHFVQEIQRLSAGTKWERLREFEMKFDTFHPQGMVIIGERIYISSVQVIDHAKGKGIGHLFEANMQGDLLRHIELGEGPAYHPGGIDYDGHEIWVPVAEYRPDSHTVVYAVDPSTMNARRVFEFDDHLGGIVHDVEGETLIANSWGSRRFFQWPTSGEDVATAPGNPKEPTMTLNPSHFIDYQDGQMIAGTNTILCSGVKGYRNPEARAPSFSLGGIALIDTRTLTIIHEVPIPLWVNGRQPMTQNPTFVQASEGGLTFYFMPADNKSTMYVYRPKLGR